MVQLLPHDKSPVLDDALIGTSNGVNTPFLALVVLDLRNLLGEYGIDVVTLQGIRRLLEQVLSNCFVAPKSVGLVTTQGQIKPTSWQGDFNGVPGRWLWLRWKGQPNQ